MSSLLVVVVQILATATTITLFAAGIPMIRKIRSAGETGTISPVPWFTQISNCLMWTKYGLLVGDKMILGVNLVGVLTALYYLNTYSEFSKGGDFQRTALKAAAVTYTPLVLLQGVHTYENAVLFMGYYASCLSVLLFGSPLINAVTVIKTKSSASMNVLQSVMSFACACSWATYGMLIHDNFVIVPNLLGSVLGLLQLALLQIYPR